MLRGNYSEMGGGRPILTTLYFRLSVCLSVRAFACPSIRITIFPSDLLGAYCSSKLIEYYN